MNAGAGSVCSADRENNVTIEHVKAFGTWLSNMVYWVLEPVFGQRAVDAVAVDDLNEALAAHDRHQKLIDQMDRMGTGMYGSQGEALIRGGMGIKVGTGTYI